jgi:F0F1-type ATP synthase assembly protein I
MYNGSMSKRILSIIILTLLPFGAAAADTVAPADGLGPQSVSASAGGSNADATALQPAGLSPIQSSTADSTGLTAPSGSLQAPSTADDQLKVLSGEADGTPHQVDDTSATPWGWLILSLLIALVAGAGVIVRDRRRFAHTNV